MPHSRAQELEVESEPLFCDFVIIDRRSSDAVTNKQKNNTLAARNYWMISRIWYSGKNQFSMTVEQALAKLNQALRLCTRTPAGNKLAAQITKLRNEIVHHQADPK